MIRWFQTKIGRLRLLAFAEGFSLLFMVFVTVPLRTFFNISTLSSIVGPIHGVLFILFVLNTLSVAFEEDWQFSKTTWKVLLACFIPFGTFYIDHKILKPIHHAQLNKI